MIFHIVNDENFILFSNSKQECIDCLECNSISSCRKIVCPITKEERRVGYKYRQNTKLHLCSNIRETKTSTLFRAKIDILSYTIPSMLQFKSTIEQVVRNEEREKYSKIVHNLKTLNGQSLLNQYKFISQDLFAEHYEDLFSVVLEEVKKRPKDATIAILKQSKNNEYMKTEFSTHEKLSIENPTLFLQKHNVRKVILNVYHSFDMDFRGKHVSLKIDDVNYMARFDYDTVRVAIFHIFSNAIKYIANYSSLNVKLLDQDDYIIIDFMMKSLYIYPEEIEHVFQDHFSGRVAVQHHLNGSGLGLGLLKRALKINGGDIVILPGKEEETIKNIVYGDNIFRIFLPKK